MRIIIDKGNNSNIIKIYYTPMGWVMGGLYYESRKS